MLDDVIDQCVPLGRTLEDRKRAVCGGGQTVLELLDTTTASRHHRYYGASERFRELRYVYLDTQLFGAIEHIERDDNRGALFTQLRCQKDTPR
ncbi:MAG: hypothetical protein Ct9H300mP8_11090 [Gammaproteobacteria bacterium]|nr:MAG: hypothetical protein Ct9H300mP8_11090 [Gammaproteobacteria bacterium]